MQVKSPFERDSVMNRQNDSGSTLIEVIVAMLILSVIIIGLNTGVVSLITSNANSKELSAASSVGYQLFEQMRRSDYDTLVMNGSSTDTVRVKYVRNWRLTTDTTKTKIDLQVRWPSTTLKHSLAMSTIISRP